MTPLEFRASLDRLGVTQVAAAALLGVTVRHINRWATGARPIPPIAANLLHALERLAA